MKILCIPLSFFFFLSWKFKLNLESIQFFEALILNWKLIYSFHQKQIMTTSHLTNNFSILKKSHSNWFHLNWFHIHKDFSFRKLLFSPPIWAIIATWSCSGELFPAGWHGLPWLYKHCTTYKIISFSNFSQQLLNEIFWKLNLIPKILFLTSFFF